MQQLTNTYIFGILLCLVSFSLSMKLRQKTGSIFVNPFIISIVLIIGVLLIFDIPYENFTKGADGIKLFLGPITVLIAVPLYRHRALLNRYKTAIFVGIFSGSLSCVLSIIFLSKILKIDDLLKNSLIAKSVTAPIAIEITRQIGGIEGIIIFGVVISGILGSIIAPFIYRVIKIKSPIAQGVGLGTASHAIGTSKALEIGDTQGAISGLAIGIAGIMTVFIVFLLNIFALL